MTLTKCLIAESGYMFDFDNRLISTKRSDNFDASVTDSSIKLFLFELTLKCWLL